MYRGEIWWANLPEPLGSEPGYRRPILIVQDDIFTQSRISTVIVVIITSNTQLAQAPGNVLLPHEATGLPRARDYKNSRSVVRVGRAFMYAFAVSG